MTLAPTELERLTIYTAAELARRHRAKGLKLNQPEATALIADEILEGAREGRSVADLIGDRPVQVGSHYHFFEANRALEFDRAAAWGMHLDISAGTAVRFEPGESREVDLTEFGGTGELSGLNDLTGGTIRSDTRRDAALRRARDRGFRGA